MTKEQWKKQLIASLDDQRKIFNVPANDRAFTAAKRFVEDAIDCDGFFIVDLETKNAHFKASNLSPDAFIEFLANWILSGKEINSDKLSWDAVVKKVNDYLAELKKYLDDFERMEAAENDG